MYTNADSILNKREELMAMVELHHYDIIVITETLPKNRENMDMQVLELGINGYNCIQMIQIFTQEEVL